MNIYQILLNRQRAFVSANQGAVSEATRNYQNFKIANLEEAVIDQAIEDATPNGFFVSIDPEDE